MFSSSNLFSLAATIALLLLPQFSVNATPPTPQCRQQPLGLTAWWPFDENPEDAPPPTVKDLAAYDAGGSANNGTIVGSILGTGEGAFFLNADYPQQHGYVEVQDHAEVDLGAEDFTLLARIKPEKTGPAVQVLLEKRAGGRGYRVYLQNGRPRVLLQPGMLSS